MADLSRLQRFPEGSAFAGKGPSAAEFGVFQGVVDENDAFCKRAAGGVVVGFVNRFFRSAVKEHQLRSESLFQSLCNRKRPIRIDVNLILQFPKIGVPSDPTEIFHVDLPLFAGMIGAVRRIPAERIQKFRKRTDARHVESAPEMDGLLQKIAAELLMERNVVINFCRFSSGRKRNGTAHLRVVVPIDFRSVVAGDVLIVEERFLSGILQVHAIEGSPVGKARFNDMERFFPDPAPDLRPRVSFRLRPPAEVGVVGDDLAEVAARLKEERTRRIIFAHDFHSFQAGLILLHLELRLIAVRKFQRVIVPAVSEIDIRIVMFDG